MADLSDYMRENVRNSGIDVESLMELASSIKISKAELSHLEEVFYIEQSKVKFQLAEVCLACTDDEINALRWLKLH
jgi:hypothetical protein